ncbi:MAG: hypothetical protein FJX40_16230 [Alphaproteobacteria bacterium]|nr:hypothetical protein [Alphaproteobacteria bacterium]MBM3878305.1 hypothetical protein [Verrucomicrobiota bacterium]
MPLLPFPQATVNVSGRGNTGCRTIRVEALAQTKDGYLWIGTTAGLARFDGLAFRRFNSANLPELASDRITALAADVPHIPGGDHGR